jgi:dihydrodipicolinate synthase/N-acetylneuraminate lyase
MYVPEGVIVAMLTPFDRDGKIRETQVRKFVNFLIDKKVDGLFPLSSCGEYVHMDMAERKFLIDMVVDEAAGRVDVIPGTGATCYHQSIELANYAKQKGCKAIVLHGPYFFKNSEEVVEGHLKKVAQSVNIPIFLYNIPFFANEITPAIAERLCQMPNVVGIKDSSGNMINLMNIIEMTKKVNPDFNVLVGVEEIMLPAMLMGGRGCMTATAGILPEFMTGIWKACQGGNINVAYNLQLAILPLIREMKSFNFPQGFKEALDTRGIEMGPPKMNYPPESLSKLADLKERLRLEMRSLLDTYFPGTPLLYRAEDKDSKFSYPELPQIQSSEKKYPDCTMCGMCSGSGSKYINSPASSTILQQEKQSANDTENRLDAIKVNEEDIERIVSEIIQKLIK